MIFEIQNRAYSDNDTPEIAGKLLPAHPINRYKTFTKLWQQTRKIGGYVPRPAACAAKQEDYFPCCLKCAISVDAGSAKEVLAHRSALAGWLLAEWVWDFGFTLPEEFVSFGVGITVPEAPAKRDRVFVFTPDLRRGYLDTALEEHAAAKINQHEARVRIFSSLPNVQYPGEIIASTTGTIRIAISRDIPFGQGITVSDRYSFWPIEMPYNLPILVNNSDIVREGDKILLHGVALN